jgi:peptidoglycan/LPS O-acetylase OafA/YrhL
MAAMENSHTNPESHPNTKENVRRIRALDGLRGWGAVSVVLFHVFIEIFPVTPEAGRAMSRVFIFNGPLAVEVFFMLSGFSLSIAALSGAGRARAFAVLAGRYFRLTVPILLACLVMWIASHLGLFMDAWHRDQTSSLAHIVKFAIFDVYFDNELSNSPIPPLWSMPFELAGSAVVLLILIATERSRIRFALYAIVVAICTQTYPEIPAFIVGVMFAEIWALNMAGAKRKILSHAATWLIIPAFCLAAITIPEYDKRTLMFVAIPITFSLIFSDGANRFLSGRVSQFLGSISFPLYLLQILPVFSLGAWLFERSNSITEKVLSDCAIVVVSVLLARLLRRIDVMGIVIAKSVGSASLSAIKFLTQPSATSNSPPRV